MVVRTALWTMVRAAAGPARCPTDGVEGNDACTKVQPWMSVSTVRASGAGVAGAGERTEADVDHLGLLGVEREGEHTFGLVQGLLGLVHLAHGRVEGTLRGLADLAQRGADRLAGEVLGD